MSVSLYFDLFLQTLNGPVKSVEELPDWNYDGSSTGQAPGSDSEVIIKPRRIFPDPFRGGDNIIVICDTYTPQGVPLPTNHRAIAAEIFKHQPELEPWYGLEQVPTLSDRRLASVFLFENLGVHNVRVR